MTILNLTQHNATPAQITEGVVDLVGSDKDLLVKLLTFNTLPTVEEIESRAQKIAYIASDLYIEEKNNWIESGLDEDDFEQYYAMIGGAPFLMGPLEVALKKFDIIPVYAFSVRDSVDVKQADGSVKKTAVFNHGGFIGL